MRKLVSAAALLFLLPLALMAQQTSRAEFFTGFSYLRLEKTNLNGWNASLDGKVNKNLGIVADVSGHYNSQLQTVSGIQSKSSLHIHSILVGPRVSESAGRWTPYAQALFGWARLNTSLSSTGPGTPFSTSGSTNAFAVDLGGGIDFKMYDALALRVIQIDYVLLHANSQKQQGVRIGAGLVFLLGTKQ